jgi:hypothetical protein
VSHYEITSLNTINFTLVVASIDTLFLLSSVNIAVLTGIDKPTNLEPVVFEKLLEGINVSKRRPAYKIS